MCHPQGIVNSTKLSESALRKHFDALLLQEIEETPNLKNSSQSFFTSRRSNSISSTSSDSTIESVSYDADIALCLVGSGLIRSLRDGNHVDITYTEDNAFQMVGDELAVSLSKEQIMEATPDTSITSHIPSEVSKDILDILL
mmetsp:Transcript_20898/g.29500  ORF Transcript_20898/g.29500 Transcript_20898/m.29500 type:complete len:142 (+) Transcript_20898:103-528(+)